MQQLIKHIGCKCWAMWLSYVLPTASLAGIIGWNGANADLISRPAPFAVRQPLHWNNVITSAGCHYAARARFSGEGSGGGGGVTNHCVLSLWWSQFSSFQVNTVGFFNAAPERQASSNYLRAVFHFTSLFMILIPSLITQRWLCEQSHQPTLGLRACGSRSHFH